MNQVNVLTAPQWLKADWPAPDHIHAGCSLRRGGVSLAPYASLNLALHVGDDPRAVAENRRRLMLPVEPVWLEQVHSTVVVDAAQEWPEPPRADAAYSLQRSVICAVMTADCLPVLLCDRQGNRVAAIHAGWRGLVEGIIENSVAAMGGGDETLLAWLGPAIGAQSYQIGDEVREAFLKHDPQAASGFTADQPGHWMMDIYHLARQRLRSCGITEVYGGTHCTYRESEDFYSYRREGVTGRMASVIWFE